MRQLHTVKLAHRLLNSGVWLREEKGGPNLKSDHHDLNMLQIVESLWWPVTVMRRIRTEVTNTYTHHTQLDTTL
jgi:hypothetical protein